MSTLEKNKKKFKVPHTYVIIFSIILIAAVMTYIVPAGQFERVKDLETGRTIVDATSYHRIEKNPATIFDILKSIPAGMNITSSIIFAIFIICGSFQIINSTGALTSLIGKTAKKFEGKEKYMIPLILGVITIIESFVTLTVVPFIPLGIMLARKSKYDSIIGMSMFTLGSSIAFSAGAMNPYTVGVAQTIAELPLFSGMGLRICLSFTLWIVTSWYLVRYANKIKKDPSKSIVADIEKKQEITEDNFDNFEMSKEQYAILGIVAIGIGIIVWGVMKHGWELNELASVFIGIGIVSGFVGKLTASEIAVEFINGAKTIVFGALVVGIARGILIILENGLILDTIVNSLVVVIKLLPKSLVAHGMFLVHSLLNFAIPSGSGQAATTMPLMIPVSDMIGLNRQISVLAYQMGDGFTNTINPASGSWMLFISLAAIPYERWIKFMLPLVLMWSGVGILFLSIANLINYGPF